MSDAKDDWAIDLQRRAVRHVSGAEASFHAYTNEDDWLRSDSVMLHNGYLYPDGETEFARRAKQMAIAGGMKHRVER